MAMHRTDLGEGYVLVIGAVRVRLEHKSGRRARLCVDAPADIAVTVTPDTTIGVGVLEFPEDSVIG